MTTININIEDQRNNALEYSEQPEQLQKILNELKINIEFLGLRKHFESDTEKREVISVVMERNGRRIDFEFGLSLRDSAKICLLENALSCKLEELFDKERLSILVKSRRSSIGRVRGGDYIYNAIKCFYHNYGSFNPYHYLTNSFGGFKLKNNKELFSTLDDVLYSILCSVPTDFDTDLDFEEWCDGYGYDSDSRAAEKIWKACIKQRSKLEKIFSVDEMECMPN